MGRLQTAWSRAMALQSTDGSDSRPDWTGFFLGAALTTGVVVALTVADLFSLRSPARLLSSLVVLVAFIVGDLVVRRVRPQTGRGAYSLGGFAGGSLVLVLLSVLFY